MPPGNERVTRVFAALGLLAAVTFLYSLLITRTLLAWLVAWSSLAVSLLVLYLLWRLVRAHERIAAAMESGERTRSNSPDE